MNVKSNAQIVHSESEEVHSIVGTSPERINNSKNDDFLECFEIQFWNFFRISFRFHLVMNQKTSVSFLADFDDHQYGSNNLCAKYNNPIIHFEKVHEPFFGR